MTPLGPGPGTYMVVGQNVEGQATWWTRASGFDSPPYNKLMETRDHRFLSGYFLYRLQV